MATALSLIHETPATRWSKVLGPEGSLPHESWASFDRTPWRHPWLTKDNLATFRGVSDDLLREIFAASRLAADIRNGISQPPPSDDLNVAFVGNMANLNYTIASSLRRRGIRAPLYTIPGDSYLLSRPEWEEFDGELAEQLLALGPDGAMPKVADIFQPAADAGWYQRGAEHVESLVEPEDVARWPACMPYLPLVKELAAFDILVANQVQYLAYLSRRPYVFIPSGGDLWLEPSKDNDYGRIQMFGAAFARAIFISNPIPLAHLRRYGLNNAIYFPWFLDDEIYSPGPPEFRPQWAAQSGGNFFVLISARIDDTWKGSQTALEGFAKFAKNYPSARLVVIGWGAGASGLTARLEALDLDVQNKVLILPVAGKRRLIRYLRSADCLVDQFVLGYYGGTALEAMACGRPVIMRLERAQYEGLLHGDAPPTLDATTPDEVAGRLLHLANSKDAAKQIGKEARDWFLRNHGSSRFARPFIEILRWLANGNSFDFSGSPLCSPKNDIERTYLTEQLKGAPVYPNYS